MARTLAETLVPWIIAPLYWLLSLTWKIEEKGPSETLDPFVRRSGPCLPCLYAHWHGDELVLVGYYAHRRLAVLSSLSKDGTIMARTLKLLGYQVFRGSSSKGGARGLIAMIHAVKRGAQAALAVDGPKGPIYEVKPGIIELARRTGKPVVPVRTRADRYWAIPRAWNRSYLPKPFARISVEYGSPLLIGDDADLPAECRRVKAVLDGLSAREILH